MNVPVQWLWIWGPALLQMAAIFTLSSFPQLPALPGGLVGYTGHFIGYFILGAAFLRALARARWAGVTPTAAALAWLAAAAYGVTDELHQSLVPGRDASRLDWFADLAGAAVGVAAVLAWRQLSHRDTGSRAV